MKIFCVKGDSLLHRTIIASTTSKKNILFQFPAIQGNYYIFVNYLTFYF